MVKAFSAPGSSIGSLDAAAASALIAAASDLALVIDDEGVIRDVAFGTPGLAGELTGHEDWIGRPWIVTVARDSEPKIDALIGEAGLSGKRRHVNLLSASGASVPILFSTAQLGTAGWIVALGRDLRPLATLQQRLVEAQQSMERDHARLRQTETPYRLLFQSAAEPVLIAEAASLRVVEANPAAVPLLGRVRRSAARPLLDLFDPVARASAEALFSGVRKSGRPDEVRARLADGREVLLSAWLFRQDDEPALLVRFIPTEPDADVVALPKQKSKLLKLMERAPDAIVVTSPDGRIVTANTAFLDLAQLASEQEARGEPLDRWLGPTSAAVEVLTANLRQYGSVRLFPAAAVGEHGTSTKVEVSAVTAMNGGQPCYGFLIRDVGARVNPEPSGRRPHRSVDQLTELIGRVPLKDLVREATDSIERLCIEAALELTGDNRASAAEMLGLSRQSLYVKLRRYGLGDLGPDLGDAD